MFRTYYYGPRKWDNYLLDIDEDIRNAGDSAQALRRESGDLHASVRGGFEGLRAGMDGLQSGIENLGAEFQLGFSLLADRMDRQISIMADIARKLDGISAALDTPLDKQARELFRIGVDRLRDGLDDRALEAFLRSEEKNDVDFALQLYIGKIYLYGKGTRDLRKATEHLLMAARYAEAKRGRIDDWNRYAGEAYFHAAVAAYVEGDRALGDGSPNDRGPLLKMALGLLGKARSLWPKFLEIAYTEAKCFALLESREGVKECFEFLADRDRRYFLKAAEDRDFDNLRNLVKEVEHETIGKPGPLSQQIVKKLKVAAEALMWARRGIAEGDQDSARLDAAEEKIAAIKKEYESHNGDLVGMDLKLDTEIDSLQRKANVSLAARLHCAQDKMAKNTQREQYLQSQIPLKTSQVNSQSGLKMGCGIAALSYFILGPVILMLLGALWRSLLPNSQSFNSQNFLGVGALVLISVTVTLGVVAAGLSRAKKQAPLRTTIADLEAEVAQCGRDEPALAQEVARSSTELREFTAWRDVTPAVPPRPGDRKVTLSSVGPNIINTIKVIRELTGLELKEAKDLVDGVPSTVLWAVSPATAEEAVSKFRAVGATASIEQMQSRSRTS